MDIDIPETKTAPLAPAGSPFAHLAAPARDETKNWAEDETVRNRIVNNLSELLARTRERRGPLNDIWALCWKVWSLEHVDQGYEGYSNIYAPAGKKAIETQVAQAISATFPGDDNFSVDPLNENDDATLAADMNLLMKYRLENTAKIRDMAEIFYRQLFITGNSPVKVHYRRKKISQRGYNKGGVIEDKDYVLYDGPVAEVVDAANLYYWPDTVQRLEDASVVFEDLTVSAVSLRQKAARGLYVQSEVEKAISAAKSASKNLVDADRLGAQGLASSVDSEAVKGFGMVDVTEVFLDFDPMAADETQEKNPVPFLITLSADGKTVLRAIENPFWHKRNPYLMARQGLVPGRAYGTGVMEGIRSMQILLNDQINQSMDCANYILNPIAITNSNALDGPLPDMEPGMNIPANDINAAIRFDRPPPDLIQVGSVLTTQTMGWIMDFSGSPPVLQGGSSPGRAFKTATGIGTANSNAKVPLQEVVHAVEVQVLDPLLEMFFALDQQFAEDAVMTRVIGCAPKRVDPRTLGYNWNFRWRASTQTSNQQVKGQQLMQGLQLMTSPANLQALQAQGKIVDPEPMLRRFYSEVLGLRDFDKVVKSAPVPAPGGMPGAPGMPPPPPAPAAPNESGHDGFPDLEGGYQDQSEDLLNPEHSATRISADMHAAMSGPLGGSKMPLGDSLE